MENPKLPWWIGPVFSLGIGLVTWLAAPYLPQGLTAAGIVSGIFCVLISIVATLWHFKAMLGRLATGLLMIISLAFAAYASVFFWQKANAAPPPAPTVKRATKPLKYRLCGQFVNKPYTNQLAEFDLEIDPINPNGETVHVIPKRSFLIFDDVPSKKDLGKQEGFDVTPQANITPASTVLNIKDWVDLPPRNVSGTVRGRYHYEFKVGPDEDRATQPMEINGTVMGFFEPDGSPVGEGLPYFTATSDKNVTFDPQRCKFYWLEDDEANAKR